MPTYALTFSITASVAQVKCRFFWRGSSGYLHCAPQRPIATSSAASAINASWFHLLETVPFGLRHRRTRRPSLTAAVVAAHVHRIVSNCGRPNAKGSLPSRCTWGFTPPPPGHLLLSVGKSTVKVISVWCGEAWRKNIASTFYLATGHVIFGVGGWLAGSLIRTAGWSIFISFNCPPSPLPLCKTFLLIRLFLFYFNISRTGVSRVSTWEIPCRKESFSRQRDSLFGFSIDCFLSHAGINPLVSLKLECAPYLCRKKKYVLCFHHHSNWSKGSKLHKHRNGAKI